VPEYCLTSRRSITALAGTLNGIASDQTLVAVVFAEQGDAIVVEN
jgi:hypothetical protein